MISTILVILCTAINIYALLCTAAIVMTWFPGAKFTKFGKILSSITDPYLKIFSKNGKLVFGNLDFSSVLALAILWLASSILGRIISTGSISLGGILAAIISMFWSICSTFLFIFAVLIFVRWIVLLINHGETAYDSVWNRIDAMLQKTVYKIAGTFSKNTVSYQKALLISWITLAVILVFGSIMINILASICTRLPI